MKHPLSLAGAVAAGLVLATVGMQPAAAAPLVPTQSYIVTLSPAASVVTETTAALAAALGGTVTHTYSSALKGFSISLPPALASALSALPGVLAIEPDSVMRIDATQPNPPSYGLDRIDQRNLPLSSSYTTASSGAGVTAYIIDTGIRFTHQDLVGRATSGTDEIDGGTADDCNGHGTHVSGTVGGTTFGVAKSVNLVAVRVLDCDGSGANSAVIAGIDWMTANHQAGAPAVANMSLGGSTSAALDTAVSNAIADGITMAVAAGNDADGLLAGVLGTNNACNHSPSRVPAAITVGATTNTDAKASYSNFGSCLDIFAPGTGITSSWGTSDTATNTISGTSMATPHVAGAAALLLSQTPSLTPAQVASALVTASTPGKVTGAGSGSPNRLLFVS